MSHAYGTRSNAQPEDDRPFSPEELSPWELIHQRYVDNELSLGQAKLRVRLLEGLTDEERLGYLDVLDELAGIYGPGEFSPPPAEEQGRGAGSGRQASAGPSHRLPDGADADQAMGGLGAFGDFRFDSESSSQDGNFAPSETTHGTYRRYGNRFERELERSRAGLEEERGDEHGARLPGQGGGGGSGLSGIGPPEPSHSSGSSSRTHQSSRTSFQIGVAPSLFSRVDQPGGSRHIASHAIPWLIAARAQASADPHQQQLQRHFAEFKDLSKVLKTMPQKPPYLLSKHWDSLLKDEYVDLAEVFANFSDPLPALQTVAHLSAGTSIVSGATPASRRITNPGDWQIVWNIFQKAYLWMWRSPVEAAALSAYAENFQYKLSRTREASWPDAIRTEARFRLRLSSDRQLSFGSLVEFNDQFFTDVTLGAIDRRPGAPGGRQTGPEAARPLKRKAPSSDEACERFNRSVDHKPCGRPHVCSGGCGGALPRPQCPQCNKRGKQA
jgi:hypothetical protein